MARVLHLISSDARRGAEVFATELADHHRAVGHEVRVLAIQPSGNVRRLPVEVAGRHRFGPVGLGRAIAAARWADVVVSFGSTSLISGALVARIARRPFVYRNIGDPSVWGAARFAEVRVGVPLRTAAAVVGLYPGARDTLIERYRLDPDIVRVIPRGVPTDRFRSSTPAERAEARVRLDLPAAGRWLAYMGALSSEKDPLAAIDVLGHLDESVGLIIAGDGPMREEVTERARPYGARVVMLGSVDDVRPVLAAADVLVLTSTTEGIPGVVIEASLSAIPTVAFDVGGVSRTIDDGVTGRLIGPRDVAVFAEGVRQVLVDPETMGRAAQVKCTAEFGMANVGGRWEAVIDAVTSDDSAGPPSVLHVTASADRRGAEVFAKNLNAALVDRGWPSDVVAVAPGRGPGSLPIRVLGRSRWSPVTFVRLLRSVFRSDIVVAHGSSSLLAVAVAATLVRRPFVYRVIGDPRYWGRARGANARIGLPMRRAAVVVCLASVYSDWVVRRYGVDPTRVEVSPNAVEAGELRPTTPADREAARAALDVPPGHRVFGFLGSLSTEKRPEWAVEVARRIPDAFVLLCGDGDLRPDLERTAERVAPGRVRFLGEVDRPATFFASLDRLMIPSRTEGIPAVLIEAALCELPVVATDVGVVASVVEELGAGVVVPSTDLDAFVAALEAPLAASDAARAQRYTIDNVTGEWAQMLTRVTHRTDPAAAAVP